MRKETKVFGRIIGAIVFYGLIFLTTLTGLVQTA
jgi:hypothetical protein